MSQAVDSTTSKFCQSRSDLSMFHFTVGWWFNVLDTKIVDNWWSVNGWSTNYRRSAHQIHLSMVVCMASASINLITTGNSGVQPKLPIPLYSLNRSGTSKLQNCRSTQSIRNMMELICSRIAEQRTCNDSRYRWSHSETRFSSGTWHRRRRLCCTRNKHRYEYRLGPQKTSQQSEPLNTTES